MWETKRFAFCLRSLSTFRLSTIEVQRSRKSYIRGNPPPLIPRREFSCIICLIISIVRLYVQNYAHKMLKRPYERISFAAIAILFLALSLIVWPNSFMPGFFIIPFRSRTRFMASSFEEKWWRNAPFSTVRFIKFLDKSTTIL